MDSGNELREFLRSIAGAVYSVGKNLKLSALAVALTKDESPNFTIFEISDSEIVLVVKICGVTVYAGIEGEGLLEDETSGDLRTLISSISRATRRFRGRLHKEGVIYDDMSPEMREFLYDVLIKHVKGRTEYDQVEAA